MFVFCWRPTPRPPPGRTSQNLSSKGLKVRLVDEIADVYASGEDEIDFGDLRDINSFESTVIIEADVIPTKYLKLPPKQKAIKKTTWTSSELADLLSPWSKFGISPKETNEIIERNAMLLEDPAFYLEFKSIKPEPLPLARIASTSFT